jgi:hypothetical protein
MPFRTRQAMLMWVRWQRSFIGRSKTSEADMPDWLQLILIGTVILGLVGYVWRTHEHHDQERDDKLWDQIGRSSEEGMRKVVHDNHGADYGHVLEISELKRRVEHLERKVFNGHGRAG